MGGGKNPLSLNTSPRLPPPSNQTNQILGFLLRTEERRKGHGKQVLSDFAGFALSETLPVSQYLQPETKLLCGCIYHLVPLDCTPQKSAKKKRVRFLIPGEEAEHESGVVRIKLVVTKQELQKMLKDGVFPADEMISQPQTEEHRGGADNTFRADFNDKGRRPALESIPE